MWVPGLFVPPYVREQHALREGRHEIGETVEKTCRKLVLALPTLAELASLSSSPAVGRQWQNAFGIEPLN